MNDNQDTTTGYYTSKDWKEQSKNINFIPSFDEFLTADPSGGDRNFKEALKKAFRPLDGGQTSDEGKSKT